jgi:predicted aconitase with swiveling domain
MKEILIKGRGIYRGVAEGPALISKNTIQGWSGIDRNTGIIIEPDHPFQGYSLKGSVLIVNGGKGSTGWATHFNELKILNMGPVAMIFPKIDSRTASAIVLANVPAITDLNDDIFDVVNIGDWIKVDGNKGIIKVIKK